MPRYFFHIRDGAFHEIDPVGLEFPSIEHAILDAKLAAREILAEKVINGELVDGQHFEIADEDGRVLETVPFRSAIRLC